jgi:hypothetical protein
VTFDGKNLTLHLMSSIFSGQATKGCASASSGTG